MAGPNWLVASQQMTKGCPNGSRDSRILESNDPRKYPYNIDYIVVTRGVELESIASTLRISPANCDDHVQEVGPIAGNCDTLEQEDLEVLLLKGVAHSG